MALSGYSKGFGVLGRSPMAGFSKGQRFPGGRPRTIPRVNTLHKGIPGTGILRTIPRPPGATPQNPGGTPPPRSTPPPAATPGTGSTDPGDPRDAAYYQNIAANQFKVNNQVNALNLRRSQAGTSLQTALGQLAYQQPRQQLALEQRANQTGGLYSSAYGQNQGNLAHGFAERQSGLQTNYGNTVAGIASQIAALQGGLPIFEHGQYLAAAGRAAREAANNPATGQDVPATPPPPAPGGGPTSPAGTVPVSALNKGISGKGIVRTIAPVPFSNPRARNQLSRAIGRNLPKARSGMRGRPGTYRRPL